MHLRNRLRRWLGLSLVLAAFFFVCVQIQQYRMTTVVGWDLTTSRDINEYIRPGITTTLIKPSAFCASPLFLLIIVCSTPSNFEARIAIRETWGKDSGGEGRDVRTYFLLGETPNPDIQDKIQLESQAFGDVIQEKFIDSYNNLTLKSGMLLKLIDENCGRRVEYVMKTDDDMFVNVGNLAASLIARNSSANLLMGVLMCHKKPIRDCFDKWFVPEYMYDLPYYPNYLSGTGYVMSSDVPRKLLSASLTTPLIHLEDVYFTGICAQRVGIRPVNHPAFTYFRVAFDPCKYKSQITTHHFMPDDLRQIYPQVSGGNLADACELQMKIANVTASVGPSQADDGNYC